MTRTDFLALTDSVDDFLSKQGIDFECFIGDPVSPKKVDRLEEELGFELHPTVREFYQTVGDGFMYTWEKSKMIRGSVMISDLEDLPEDMRFITEVANHWLAEPPADARPELRTPPEILAQFRKTLTWSQMFEYGDGDSICWDLETGHVVYNKHDFNDVGASAPIPINGRIAGKTIFDFVRHWSRYCFMAPSGYWWGALIDGDELSLSWDPKVFPSDFDVQAQ